MEEPTARSIYEEQKRLSEVELLSLKSTQKEFSDSNISKRTIFISRAWPLQPSEDIWDEEWTGIFATTLPAHLRSLGFKIIIDVEQLGVGVHLNSSMRNAVNTADHVLLLITHTYLYKIKEFPLSGVATELNFIRERISLMGGATQAGERRFLLPFSFVNGHDLSSFPLVESFSGFAAIHFRQMGYLNGILELAKKLCGLTYISTSNLRQLSPVNQLVRIMASNFKNRLTKAPILMQSLHYYVWPEVTTQCFSDERLSLRTKITEFLDGKNNTSVILLQGDSGSGKSIFLNKLSDELWDNAELNSFEQTTVIPLLIEFKSYKKSEKDYVYSLLEQEYGFNNEQIRLLKSHCRFVLMLDGYDEFIGEKNIPIDKLFNGLEKWDLKVIITCRSVFLSKIPHYQLMFSLGGSHNDTMVTEWWMAHFNTVQVNHLLENYAQIQGLQESLPEYQSLFNDIPNLRELSKTPLLLRLILEILTVLNRNNAYSFTRADIYKQFMAKWFEREGKRLLDVDGHFPSNDFSSERYFGDFVQELAFQMFIAHPENSLLEVQYRPETHKRPGKYVNQRSQEISNVWDKFFKDDDSDKARKRAGCPLRCVNYAYSFYHKSFFEYFVALFLYYDLGLDSKNDENFEAALEHLNETGFNKKLIVKEPEISVFLAEMIKNDPKNQERLLKVVKASKKDPTVEKSASNAITILNFAHFPFSGLDLSDIKIPYADLTNAILDNTNLARANLTGVRLHRIWGRDCNLEGANLDEVDFGEMPILIHSGGIYAMSISPNGYWLAVAGEHGFSLWDIESNTLKYVLNVDTYISVSFDINSEHIALVNKAGQVKFLNTTSKKVLASDYPSIEECRITEIAFCPQENSSYLLVSVGHDRATRLWDVQRGVCEKVIKKGKGSLDEQGYDYHVTFSRDGLLALVEEQAVDEEQEILIWNINKSDIVYQLLNEKEFWYSSGTSINCMAFSPDGKLLAAGRGDNDSWGVDCATILLWQVGFRKHCAVLTGHTAYVSSVAFSPHSSELLASSSWDQTVRLWDVKSAKTLRIFYGHSDIVTSVVFSVNGQRLISGSYDKTIRQWEIKQEASQTISMQHIKAQNVLVSSDSQWIAFAGSNDSGEGQLYLCDAKSGQVRYVFKIIIEVLLSPDSQRLVFQQSETSVKVWNTVSGMFEGDLKINGIEDYFIALSLSPDGKYLILQDTKRGLWLWDCLACNNYAIAKANTKESDRDAAKVIFSKDSQFLAFCNTGYFATDLVCLDLLTKAQYILKGESRLLSFAFQPIHNLLAIGNQSSTIRVFERDKELYTFSEPHLKNVTKISFSPDGTLLAAESSDRIVVVWELHSKKIKYIFDRIPGEDDTRELVADYVCSCVEFSPNGSYLITLGESNKKSIRVWDVSSGACVGTLEGYTNDVRELYWFPNNNGFVTLDGEGGIQGWSLIEKFDNGVDFHLIWSTHNHLYTKGCNLENVKNLSTPNRTLLTQNNTMLSPRLSIFVDPNTVRKEEGVKSEDNSIQSSRAFRKNSTVE